jgi:hypothetical protein
MQILQHVGILTAHYTVFKCFVWHPQRTPLFRLKSSSTALREWPVSQQLPHWPELTDQFFEAFASSRKVPITFIISVRRSVCPHVLARLPLDRVSWNLILETFIKIRPENTCLVKIFKNSICPTNALYSMSLHYNTYNIFTSWSNMFRSCRTILTGSFEVKN